MLPGRPPALAPLRRDFSLPVPLTSKTETLTCIGVSVFEGVWYGIVVGSITFLLGVYLSVLGVAHPPIDSATDGLGACRFPLPEGRGTEKDFIGFAVLSPPPLFPLKGEVSNYKGIFDDKKARKTHPRPDLQKIIK